MRDMGVNLRIVHRDTVMDDLYTNFAAVDFPESYVEKLANAPVDRNHCPPGGHSAGKSQVEWPTALLVGMRPVLTMSQKNAERKHMVQSVEPGTVVVGHELAAGLQGDALARRTGTATANWTPAMNWMCWERNSRWQRCGLSRAICRTSN